MFVEAVTVSVNYDDYLEISLPYLKSQVNSVFVATISDDKKTIKVCNKFKVKCIIADEIKNEIEINGGKIKPFFNKGGALSKALKACDKKDWLLVVDADIVLPPNARNILEGMNLVKENLYGSMRYTCKNYNEFQEIKLNNFKSSKLKIVPKNNPLGFFQLFHSSAINDTQIYPDGINAAKVDVLFRNKWEKNKHLNVDGFSVLHLGQGKINWDGRKSKRFIPIKIL